MANKNNALTKSLYPSKTVINFINQDKEKATWSLASIALVMLVLVAVFVYFGFYKPLQKIEQSQAAHNEALNELHLLQSNNQDYFDVQAEYNVLLNRFMQDEEKSCDNRVEMLNIIFDNKISGIDILSIDIDEDVLSLTISASSFGVVSDYFDNLNEDDRVSLVVVDSSNEDERDDVDSIIATYSITWNNDYQISMEGEES